MEKYPTKRKLAITAWAEEDRPREKLLLKGRQSLSNAELLGIILGSGSRNQSAVDLARAILHATKNDLHQLGKLSVAELMKYRGVGTAKAISVVAALEIGRRRMLTDAGSITKISSSRDVYTLMGPFLIDLPHEEFWILLLNQANGVIAKKQVSKGGKTGTIVDARIVFKAAIEGNAVSIVLLHNHPSGNLKPSQQDIRLTKKMVEAGRFLDVRVLDHLIIADKQYYSFADEGEL